MPSKNKSAVVYIRKSRPDRLDEALDNMTRAEQDYYFVEKMKVLGFEAELQPTDLDAGATRH